MINPPINKSIILITKCCGKGFIQARQLVEALNALGIVYNLHSVKPKSCTALLDLCGLETITALSKPHIYIEDIIFPAEKINDKEFTRQLIEGLKLINNEENKENHKRKEDIREQAYKKLKEKKRKEEG